MLLSTRYPTVTGLTTFTKLEKETHSLLCDFFHTLVLNTEIVNEVRSALLFDMDFSPLLLFQRLAKGKGSITKASLKAFLVGQGVDTVQHLSLVFPGSAISFEMFAKKLFVGGGV